MQKETAKLVPLLATAIVPSATVTSALLSPPALGAPGDLDPGFGDVGRLGPILNGPAWSLEPLEDGATLLAGGDVVPFFYYYYYYGPVATSFVSLLSAGGSTEPGFAAATIANTQVFDVVRQPDGKVVAAGRKIGSTAARSQLIVFRLQSDGSLDATFGNGGIFELSVAEHGNRHVGASIVLDPDGRIVVAGWREDRVIVVRLLPDGSIDSSFGTSGVFAGPESYASDARTDILRTAAGGYRVTASNLAGCQIVALTAGGAIDGAFGTSGIATVNAPSGMSISCNSMVAQPDGRLLVAGTAVERGFAARVLADGQPDPDFSADVVSDAMADATAMAVGEDGSIFVAGRGVSGESIMRLQVNGELDALFGNAGSTLIDLRSEVGTSPVVRDMSVRADGSVVAAGGEEFSNRAFVVRLLGADGGDSPGVLGVSEQTVIATAEGAAEVVVNVRRTGGASGSVSAAYQTAGTNRPSATEGQDYVGVAGRLTWADGDTTEHQLRIPILTDNSPEDPEYFRLMLSDAQGGAGLGTSNATVEIAADGGPFGQLSFSDSTYSALEVGGPVQVTVSRNYYSSGAVSVTVTPIAGTATAGDDFAGGPVTVSWADGDSDLKVVEFSIIDDTVTEPTESFTVELSNPAGGAVIGSLSSATVRILRNDQPPSGGGAFGYLSLLLLGIMSFLRSLRMAIRSRLAPLSR